MQPVASAKIDVVDLPADYIRLLELVGVEVSATDTPYSVRLRMDNHPERQSIPFFRGFFDNFSGWRQIDGRWEATCLLSRAHSPCRPSLEEVLHALAETQPA